MNKPVLLIPGDGAGRVVTAASRRVLEMVATSLTFETSDLGAERFHRSGVAMDSELMRRMRASEFAGVLFGAVGAPLAMAKEILLDTRQPQGLDLWANVRPVRLVDPRDCPLKGVVRAEQVDLMVVRENGEGPYSDIGGPFARGTSREVRMAAIITTRVGVERILRYAFEIARSRPKKHLTCVHKANAMPHAHGLYPEVFAAIKQEFLDVTADELYFDIAALEMAYKPWMFDVIVGDNLVCDVISDLLSGLIGGVGVAPSVNLNPVTGIGWWEPVHGTAPKILPDWLNPLGSILSCEMLLRHLGMIAEADRLLRATDHCITERKVTPDMDGGSYTTDQATDAVIAALELI
jgi:isocitrate/isopropylmalate dehydrogenase